MAEPKTMRYTDLVAAKRSLIGTKVVNAQNEDLGKVEDIVIDAADARVAYAVLSFGGFLGMGDKYFAIPWEGLHFMPSEKRIVLNVDKRLLETAPGFDKDNWPNLADRQWGAQIFTHYGYKPFWEQPPTGAVRDRF
jgi:hypothetical protein